MKTLSLFILFIPLLLNPVFAAPPDQCLNAISEAVENGDIAAFEQLVDIDAILNSAMDALLAEARKSENITQMAPMLALLFSQAAGQGDLSLRKLIAEEAKAFVLNGVGSGAFAGKNLRNSQTQGFLAPLFANASLGRKEIRDIGEPVATENGWYLPFSVHDYGNDNDYAVIGKFRPEGDRARLVGIENMDQLFNKIKKEAQAVD